MFLVGRDDDDIVAVKASGWDEYAADEKR